MNAKVPFVVVLLFISTFSIITVAPVSSSHTPSSTDDGLFEEFGPRPSQIAIKIYFDYSAELVGFKNKEFDVMDWALDPVDYQWFETNDPDHSQYSTAFEAEFGLFEYDINNQVLPTSLVGFRQAISHMLDKDYYISQQLPNAAMKVDSPIGSMKGWYNPSLTDLYNLQPRTTMLPLPDDPADWLAAYNLLIADLGSPIPDPESPGYYTWTWPSPFPTADPMGLAGPVPNGHLLDIERHTGYPWQIFYLKDCCETALPAILPTLGLPPAKIHVDLYNLPRTIAVKLVFQEYWYHFYTGGWSLSRDPDFLQYYTTAEIIKPLPNGHNYVMYSNPNYDAEVSAMMSSPNIGEPSNPCNAVYHAYLAQQILMNDAGIIPMWTYAGYKTYLANWRGVVNQVGFGVNSWWTFLNAHKVGSAGGDVIRYGWQGDLVSLNIIGATWLWDYEVLNKIYDSLIAVNPYNVAQDLPYVAKSWEIGIWNNQGMPTTKLTFNIRQDVWWQDVPYFDRHLITWDQGNVINGPFTNMQLTPIDIAFSLVYQRDNLAANAQYLMDNLDHVELNPYWSSKWPYTSTVPEWFNTSNPGGWQMNFVQYDSNLKVEQIVVKLNTFMPWLGLHRIGGVPLIPMHIWSKIPMVGSEVLDAWGNDIVYGTGPYILSSRNPGVSMTMMPFVAGQSYRGITLHNSFFYSPVRTTDTANMSSYWMGINGYSMYYGAAMRNYDSTDHNVSYFFDFAVERFDGANWIIIASGTTTTKGTVVSAGGTTYVEEEVAILASTGPNKVQWGDAVRLNCSVRLSYVLYGTTTMTSNMTVFGTVSAKVHPGDIAGTTPVPSVGDFWPIPYIAADGKVDIKDASIIGANWQKTVTLGTQIAVNGPNNSLIRADVNNDGKIDVKDATLVGFNWQKTWTP